MSRLLSIVKRVPYNFSFSGISLSAAQVFLGYRRMSDIYIVGIGIDTPSIDYGLSQNFPAHQELAAANVYVLEDLNNLSVCVEVTLVLLQVHW